MTDRHAQASASWAPGQYWETRNDTLSHDPAAWVPVSNRGRAEPVWDRDQEYRRRPDLEEEAAEYASDLNEPAQRLARMLALAFSADHPAMRDWERLEQERKAERAELERLRALVNTPELHQFLVGVQLEAVHQVERWGTAHDRAKRPADWFWLVGYLTGKALHSATDGDADKALHHCISSAAALYNWHSAIAGRDSRMCPGRSDIAAAVDAAFPGEASPP